MHRVILLGGLLCLLTIGQAVAADDKKSEKTDTAAKERLVPYGQVLGEVMEVLDGGKTIKLRLHSKQPEIKWNNNAPRPGSPGNYRNMFQGSGASVKYKDTHTDVDLVLSDEAKIRIPFRPEFDDQTKKVKPESIRSDPKDPDRKLGGLKGTEKDLRAKQWAVVTLGATRDKPPRILATLIQVVNEGDK